MHRFSSRSAESAGLTRRAIEAPASVLYGTLRRPTERNPVRTNDFGDAVENLCIIRANTYRTVLACLQVQEKKNGLSCFEFPAWFYNTRPLTACPCCSKKSERGPITRIRSDSSRCRHGGYCPGRQNRREGSPSAHWRPAADCLDRSRTPLEAPEDEWLWTSRLESSGPSSGVGRVQ